ncbi:GGDEF domain-containing protein [Tissierella creatinophila]|uniref:Putative diguanylate cyclase YdaM n=1 Tax=Tissierella creatinophila DSM 6911 TaxID=1123403 RepID=A0A1U7M3R9_TISCR|nr:GGDEF domain-containing protein [Tissierella creatinophila]OLS01964.1 putative diguanylate cyclase YdaM [Tissierella creatinophila DSM 6911]
MKLTQNFAILISMLIIGLVYGLTYHVIIMPLLGSRLILCIIQSIGFGLINYFAAIAIYKKYNVLQKSNTLLQKTLQIDKLTGLFNRRSFDNHIQKLPLDDTYSIIFIDIDNFKNFNNSFGHQIGDTVLKKVGQTIKATVRSNDSVYRYGGEEIVIILNDCDKKNAFAIAEKVRLNISELDNSPFPVITISLGISSYPEDGTEIDKIIEASDMALLTAKKLGKNQVAMSTK